MEQLIKKKKDECRVSNNISLDTVRSQIKRRSLVPTHQDTSSPLYNAVLALFEICIQLGKICQPLTGEGAIAIMNDMISKTEMSETLTEFQKVHTLCPERYGLVG